MRINLLLGIQATIAAKNQCHKSSIPCNQSTDPDNKNIICIPDYNICDGISECNDYDEEEFCSKSDKLLTPALCLHSPFWYTPSETNPTLCIPPSAICDNKPDFPDSSDEESCRETCESADNCFQQNCKVIKNYFGELEDYCYCPEGYRECRVARSQGYHRCIPIELKDKEECQNLRCDQDCKNSKCSCLDGFEISSETRCAVEDSESAILIVKNGILKEINANTNQELSSRELTDKENETVDTGFIDSFGSKACFHLTNQMKIVCFTKNDKKWIKSEILPAIDIQIVRDMNYDYVTGHYFYHVYPSNQLWACEQPNQDNIQDKCRIIIEETGLFFRRITIDPKNSLMFYIRSPAPANHPVSSAIYSRPLSGGPEQKIYTFTHSHNQFYQFLSNETVVDPVADPYALRLYWAKYFKLGFNAKETDEYKIIINRLDYNGENLEECEIISKSKPSSLRIEKSTDGYVYVTGREWKSVLKIDFTHCKSENQTIPEFDWFKVTQTHPHRNIPANPCLSENCEYMCFTRGTKDGLQAKCECDFGKIISGERCDEPATNDDMILFIDNKVDIYVKNDEKYSKVEQTLRLADFSPFSYVWNTENDMKAIFSATGRKSHRQITMRSLSNFAKSKVITYGLSDTPHIAVDPIGEVVYWATHSTGIYVSSFGSNRPTDVVNRYQIEKFEEKNKIFHSMYYDVESRKLLTIFWKPNLNQTVLTIRDDLSKETGRLEKDRIVAEIQVDPNETPLGQDEVSLITDMFQVILKCQNKINLIHQSIITPKPDGVNLHATLRKAIRTHIRIYSFALPADGTVLNLNDDKSLYTAQNLPDGYFSHGRTVACDPNNGLITTLSHNMFSKTDKIGLYSFTKEKFIDDIELEPPSGFTWGSTAVAVPSHPDLSKKKECLNSHIELRIARTTYCLCNDGYSSSDPEFGFENSCSINENFKITQQHCKNHEFKCSNENCIEKAYVCDGDDDCGDSSDEKNCDECSDINRKFKCATVNECIEEDKKCDGNFDCTDMSDELNCLNVACPEEYEPCQQISVQYKQRTLCYKETEGRTMCDLPLKGSPVQNFDILVTTDDFLYTVYSDEKLVRNAAVNNHQNLSCATLSVVSGPPVLLILDRNFTHSHHPIVPHILTSTLEDEHPTWTFPYFTPTIVTDQVELKRFRYSTTYRQSYFLTSGPDAVWMEEMVHMKQSATLLYLAQRYETLIDMDLVDCYSSLFVLRSIVKPEKTSFSVLKLPGYNYHNQAGYEDTISLEKISFLPETEYEVITSVSQIITQNDFICVVITGKIENAIRNSVVCKAHDLKKKWTEIFRTEEKTLRIGYSSNGELFILDGSNNNDDDIIKMNIRRQEFSIDTISENDFNFEISFSGNFQSSISTADITSKSGPKCSNKPCDINVSNLDHTTAMISPDNGGCEFGCTYTDAQYVQCSCPSGLLRSDFRTCLQEFGGCQQDDRDALHLALDEDHPLKHSTDGVHYWQCSLSKMCLLIDQVCDGIVDCDYQEDELFCQAWYYGEQSIRKVAEQGPEKLVDHFSRNQEIEGHMVSHTPCPIHYFKCMDGQCVLEHHVRWVDDEKNDKGDSKGCRDRSDAFQSRFFPQELFCYHNPKSDQCIQVTSRNLQPNPDADLQISDHEFPNDEAKDEDTEDEDESFNFGDEDAIELDQSCAEDEFTCDNGECIPFDSYCDGRADCDDLSDESECKFCGSDSYACDPIYVEFHICIPPNLKCDHIKHCPLGDDENNCGDSYEEYECKAGQYFSEATKQCHDVKQDECSVHFFPCSQICAISGGSLDCSCNTQFYEPITSAKQQCHVRSEYNNAHLMFTNQKSLQMIDIDSNTSGQGKIEKKAVVVSSGHRNIVGLDFNHKLNRFYWSAVVKSSQNDIYSDGKLSYVQVEDITDSTTYPKDLFQLNSGDPKQSKRFILPQHEQIDSLAVDWVTNNIYCGDKVRAHIKLMSAEGEFVKTLVDKEKHDLIMHPRAMAFYQAQGWLYFSDWSTSNPHIGRIGMDGSELSVLIDNKEKKNFETPIGWPNDIIIDNTASSVPFEGDWSPSPNIYWCDAKHDYIARANMNFTEVQIIHIGNDANYKDSFHAFSMSLFGDFIYYSDWKGDRAIWRIYKFCDDKNADRNCKPQKVSQSLPDKPMAVIVVHPFKQPALPNNPCLTNDGKQKCNTPQLCVLFPIPGNGTHVATVGGKCVCPDNYKYDDKDDTCRETCSEKPHRSACDDGLCIYSYQIGNGIQDCKNDETEEWSNRNLCTKYYRENTSLNQYSGTFFMCKNATETEFTKSNIPDGYCVSPRGICDNVRDCADGSDEEDCPNFECIPGSKKCPPLNGLTNNDLDSGKCLREERFCDGTYDCRSHEDEKTGINGQPCKCNLGQFACKPSPGSNAYTSAFGRMYNTCLSHSKLCNGVKDCKYGDDELPQNCPGQKKVDCSIDQFYCEKSRKCAQRCNGEIECEHAEDEIDCPNLDHECGAYGINFKCKTKDFKDSYCIPDQWACDGKVDCYPHGDDEDEDLCGEEHNHPCESGIFCNSQCLDLQKICDGSQDCPDGRDELQCNLCSDETQFACIGEADRQPDRSPKCIPQAQVCDGKDDCFNAEDEKPELCRNKDCGQGLLQCKNVGTGDNQYHDCVEPANMTECFKKHSDADTENHYCRMQGFNNTLKCDGKWDCRDGQDEHNCPLFGSATRAIHPAETYDSFGKTDCFIRDKNGVYRPNIGISAIRLEDAIPCHHSPSTCIPLRDYQRRGSICTGESIITNFDLISRFSTMNPCLLGQDKCDQLCFWKAPSKSPYKDEIVQTLGRNRIMEGLPTGGWDEWMSSYTCGCVPGYTIDPATKRCKPDISNQRYDLLFLTSVEGTLHIQSAGTVQSEENQRVYLGEEHVIKRKDNAKTIRAFASDIRRKRLFFLVNEEPTKIFSSKPLRPSDGVLPSLQIERLKWWNESSINNIYDEYASIDLEFEIEKIHFIMELDLMMVLSRPPNGRDAKMHWLSINNGNVIPNEEIMTRIGPGKSIKAVSYLQTQNCYNINRAILFISAGNDKDGDKIYPFSMTAKDLFGNDLQLKQLFDNINAPRSQRKTKKEINSIVVDPFKCIVYYSDDSDVSIWAIPTLALDKTIQPIGKPKQLASLYAYTYHKLKYIETHSLVYKEWISKPTIQMTIFENKIFAVIKDKSEPLRFFTVTVDTVTGEVDLMKRLRSVKDFQQLAIAPWMGVDTRLTQALLNHRLLECQSECDSTICLMDDNYEDNEVRVKCLGESRSARKTQAKLSCTPSESSSSAEYQSTKLNPEWKASLCYEESDIGMMSTAEKAYSWTMIVFAIVVLIIGVGLFYLYQLRSNRYIQLPPASAGIDRNGGNYGETELDTTWDTSVQQSEFNNPLFHELHNNDDGGTIMPDGPIRSGEGENLLDNDELAADNLQ